MGRACEAPIEVLSSIFYLLCNSPIKVGPEDRYRDDFPWAVGRVCWRWRHGFISYPPIWTSIAFSDSCIHDEDGFNEAARRLTIFLGRSGESPLDISLSILHSSSRPAGRLIFTCSHRWRTARITILKGQVVDDLLACRGNMPILERLEIYGPPVEERLALRGLDVCDAFKIAPRLNMVKFEGGIVVKRWVLPWSQIVKLSVVVKESSDVPLLLRELRGVEELSLKLQRMNDTPYLFNNFSVRLGQLRVLQISIPLILSWIEAPMLQELRFGDPDSTVFDSSLLYGVMSLSFIHHSSLSGQIPRLVLRGYYIKMTEIVSVLSDVEEFHICVPKGYLQSSTCIYDIHSLKLTDTDNCLLSPTLCRLLNVTFIPEDILLTLSTRCQCYTFRDASYDSEHWHLVLRRR